MCSTLTAGLNVRLRVVAVWGNERERSHHGRHMGKSNAACVVFLALYQSWVAD